MGSNSDSLIIHKWPQVTSQMVWPAINPPNNYGSENIVRINNIELSTKVALIRSRLLRPLYFRHLLNSGYSLPFGSKPQIILNLRRISIGPTGPWYLGARLLPPSHGPCYIIRKAKRIPDINEALIPDGRATLVIILKSSYVRIVGVFTCHNGYL